MRTTYSSAISSGLIIFSALAFSMVASMAFFDPQKVMDLVNVRLSGPDSFSSIRGVYGGVGFTLSISLVNLLRHNKRMALGLLSLVWGFYAVSRCLTIFIDGPLGSFGNTWLLIETLLFIISLVFWMKIIAKERRMA